MIFRSVSRKSKYGYFGQFPLTDMQPSPLSPQKWWPQKVVMKGEECAEETGKNNKKILFFFFELSSKIGVIFSQK